MAVYHNSIVVIIEGEIMTFFPKRWMWVFLCVSELNIKICASAD